MVCGRCLKIVEAIFKRLPANVTNISLGEANLKEKLNSEKLAQLENQLKAEGFELLQNSDQQLITQIKSSVLAYVNLAEPSKNLSDFLANKIAKDYTFLSKLFSQVEGRTIENYFILLRIEKAKEFITYDELTFSEIAYKLHFSNVAHLSAQFKKLTGMTPSAFKKLGSAGRKGLEKV